MAQVVDELLTVSEVAKILRVDDTTVRRWVKNDVLQAVKLPHLNKRQSYRIRRNTLNDVLEGNHQQHHNSNSHHKHQQEQELVTV